MSTRQPNTGTLVGTGADALAAPRLRRSLTTLAVLSVAAAGLTTTTGLAPAEAATVTSSSATSSVTSSVTVSHASAGSPDAGNLVSNGTFGGGRSGWGRGDSTGLAVRQVGRGDSKGARLVPTGSDAVTLFNTGRNADLRLGAGARAVASAFVRTSLPGRDGTLVLETRPTAKSSYTEIARQAFRVDTKGWTKVTTPVSAPSTGPIIKVTLRVAGLRHDTPVFVDDVRVTRSAAPVAPQAPVTGPAPYSQPVAQPVAAPVKAPTAAPVPVRAPVQAPSMPPVPPVPSAPAPSAPAPSAPAPAGGSTLLSSSFDSYPTGPMSLANFKDAMKDTDAAGTSTVANTSIVTAPGHGNVMRQHFNPGSLGGVGGGIQVFANGPFSGGTYDEATLDYDVRFAGTFDWGWGGKLPGLGGVNNLVSPGTPTGGNGATDNGWSGRMMWNTPYSYRSHLGPNEGLAYMYHPDQGDQYGDNLWSGATWTPDTWHHIKARYKMNTITGSTGNHDGILQVWFDGRLVVNRSDFLYRNRPDVHISHLYWHLFYGGGTSDWAPHAATDIDTDNLTITAN